MMRTESYMNKQKQFTKVGLMLYFLKGSKKFFVGSILMAGLMSMFDLVNPKIIGYTVDTVINDLPSTLPAWANRIPEFFGGPAYLRQHLYMIALAIIVMALCTIVCRVSFRVLNAKGSETLVERMRNTLFRHIEHLPFAWHMENKTGDIIQRCTSDVDTTRRFLADQLTSLVRIAILLVMSLVFMFRLNARLAAIAVVFLPVIILYSMYFHNRIGSMFRDADEMEGTLSAMVQENLTGVRVVRAFGREAYERTRFEKFNKEYANMWIRLNRFLAGFWASGDLISGLQVMTIVAMGAVFAVRGTLTAGQFITFVSYNNMLVWPVRMLGRVISQMSKAGISIDRILYIMNSPVEEDKENAVEPPMNKDIVFDHVSFGYGEESPEILSDVSFTIKAGTTFGILGSTGSGKSTLMYLLNRLYDLPKDGGKITIGGVDIADMKADWIRSNIGMVLQEPYLFSRTLAENISIGIPDVTEERIRSSARTASLLDTVEHMTQGFETFVGERGVTLSGGQKQRAAIAQMIIRDTPIMVFDDSLSAVDAETDAKIRHALHATRGDATLILIAHRITTLMAADKILVLDKGRVAEFGSHEELLAKNGIYRRIYDIQRNSAAENGTDDEPAATADSAVTAGA